MKRHVNVGRWQLIFWPRRRVFFWRGGEWVWARVFRFVVYVWPVEVRRFR